MGYSAFYEIAVRVNGKFPQVRAIENFRKFSIGLWESDKE